MLTNIFHIEQHVLTLYDPSNDLQPPLAQTFLVFTNSTRRVLQGVMLDGVTAASNFRVATEQAAVFDALGLNMLISAFES